MDLRIFSLPQEELPALPVKQVLRYMGCPEAHAGEDVRTLAADAAAELHGALDLKACVKRIPVAVCDAVINLGFRQVESTALAKNLRGCREAFLFTATIGFTAERLLQAAVRLSASRGLALDAAGSVAIECWCNHLDLHLRQEIHAEGLFLRPRFSPGYGDVSLQLQQDILLHTEATKRMGVSLTDGMLLMPAKSVTALIGITSEPVRCTFEKCVECEKTDCPYREG